MKINILRCTAIVALAFLAACASNSDEHVHDTMDSSNPLMIESPLPLHYPEFDKIKDADFAPAFDRGMAEQLREVEAIADNPAPPTFENTIVAMERSGQLLDRARVVFSLLVEADTNETRQGLEVEYSPRFSAHRDAISLNAKLYARINEVHRNRHGLGLDAESLRLVERYHTRFVRGGANLSGADKESFRAINTELATLETQFGQNVLAEVNASAIIVDDVKALDGLPPAQIEAAAEAARARGLNGKWVIALLNTSGQPPNTYLRDRALRKRLHQASMGRGSRGNAYDNTGILSRVAKLRAERAALLGFPTHAAYVLDDETAKTAAAVNQRLGALAPAAVANARREAEAIQDFIRQEGGTFRAEAFDWAYYAEKVRKARYAFDESQLKPYLEFERVLQDGVFFAAEKLYGIQFRKRNDLPVYHPDVRVYDVFEADGSPLAIFLLDPFARPSKSGGAWMDSYVSQSKLLGNSTVVANHLNIAEPPEGQATLMTWDEVITLFHEFGHALHGMFSDVQYPYFTGTSVPRDFVEYPSQVNEMWASWPEVLKNYARHYQTGEAMPAELIRKVLDSRKFNQGFATTEYLAAAMLDQRLHQRSAAEVPAA
ncbi:MAG: M3 family metallopeptidase, partial [Planctomycetes bacterium]|nr:M3 family metallopeptidase [Planctomycetota bacterium]